MIDVTTYLNRITSEHKTKPRFMSLVNARLQPFVDLYEFLETIDEAFDLDTAVGKQLDVIGEYIGVKRLLNFEPQSVDSALLPDDFYRILLKARISLNNWDGTTAGISQIWQGLFPDYKVDIVDNQDMTMLITMSGISSSFENEIIQHGYVNPKPMGVLINYEIKREMTAEPYYGLGSVTSGMVDIGLARPDYGRIPVYAGIGVTITGTIEILHGGGDVGWLT